MYVNFFFFGQFAKKNLLKFTVNFNIFNQTAGTGTPPGTPPLNVSVKDSKLIYRTVRGVMISGASLCVRTFFRTKTRV